MCSLEWECSVYNRRRPQYLTCSLFTVARSRIAHSNEGGNEQAKQNLAKQNLAEMFRPPHDLLFNGTFHEVCGYACFVVNVCQVNFNVYRLSLLVSRKCDGC